MAIPFDLISFDIKSKIILTVGDTTSNASAFLSSIMTDCGISHSRYAGMDRIEIKRRFTRSNGSPSIEELCDMAQAVLKRCGRGISGEALLVLCATQLLQGDEFLLLDVSEELYPEIIRHLTPFAVVFATRNDELTRSLISLAPSGVKEIVALSEEDNFDYISSLHTENGARISYASKNKITVFHGNALGTEFFHYDFKYFVPIIDQNNLPLAHLSIEAASAILAPSRNQILRGLQKSIPPDDFTVHSLSPTVLLRESEGPFTLHNEMKFKIIREGEDFLFPSEDTAFCGSVDFIARVKEQLKKK